MKRLTRSLLISILLIFSGVSLWAAITATYVTDSNLYFTTGTDLNSMVNGNPFSTSYFGAHIGTLTIYNPDNSILYPALVNMTSTIHFYYTGPMFYNDYVWVDGHKTDPIYRNEATEFTLYALSYPNGSPSLKVLTRGDHINLLTYQTEINAPQLIIDFYIINTYALDHYVPGRLYTLSSGNLGTFNIAVAAPGSNIDNSRIYVPVNGQSLPPDGTAPDSITSLPDTVTPLPYVDPDHPLPHVDYFLSILDNNSFSISEAYANSMTQVATAQVTVVPTSTAAPPYGVYIAFNDSNFDQSFSLNLEGNKNLYAIPYTLKFLSHEVTGGEQILWDAMSAGINQQAISITGIDSGTANAAPEGDYSDTITVTITPVDT